VHTHACEFIISKTSWHTKKWHAITNIGAINSRHTKIYGHKKSWIAMKICDTLLPNDMAWHAIITWKTMSLLIAKDNNIFN
jgi:hypothetical protein